MLEEGWDVSVPLRGKGRDQLEIKKEFGTDCIRIVSVPLRGKGRDQQRRLKEGQDFVLDGFRPLAGKR